MRRGRGRGRRRSVSKPCEVGRGDGAGLANRSLSLVLSSFRPRELFGSHIPHPVVNKHTLTFLKVNPCIPYVFSLNNPPYGARTRATPETRIWTFQQKTITGCGVVCVHVCVEGGGFLHSLVFDLKVVSTFWAHVGPKQIRSPDVVVLSRVCVRVGVWGMLSDVGVLSCIVYKRYTHTHTHASFRFTRLFSFHTRLVLFHTILASISEAPHTTAVTIKSVMPIKGICRAWLEVCWKHQSQLGMLCCWHPHHAEWPKPLACVKSRMSTLTTAPLTPTNTQIKQDRKERTLSYHTAVRCLYLRIKILTHLRGRP